MTTSMHCFFLSVRFPPELLPVLGLLEQYVKPTLDVALLCSSRAGSDLMHKQYGVYFVRHPEAGFESGTVHSERFSSLRSKPLGYDAR